MNTSYTVTNDLNLETVPYTNGKCENHGRNFQFVKTNFSLVICFLSSATLLLISFTCLFTFQCSCTCFSAKTFPFTDKPTNIDQTRQDRNNRKDFFLLFPFTCESSNWEKGNGILPSFYLHDWNIVYQSFYISRRFHRHERLRANVRGTENRMEIRRYNRIMVILMQIQFIVTSDSRWHYLHEKPPLKSLPIPRYTFFMEKQFLILFNDAYSSNKFYLDKKVQPAITPTVVCSPPSLNFSSNCLPSLCT